MSHLRKYSILLRISAAYLWLTDLKFHFLMHIVWTYYCIASNHMRSVKPPHILRSAFWLCIESILTEIWRPTIRPSRHGHQGIAVVAIRSKHCGGFVCNGMRIGGGDAWWLCVKRVNRKADTSWISHFHDGNWYHVWYAGDFGNYVR